MKSIGAAIAWGFNRSIKLFNNLLSLAVGCFVPVKKGRVMCWSYAFKQYSCNPRYLTEYLLEYNPEFEIYWVFRKGVDTSTIDKRIKCVRLRSWQYYLLVNSAEFLLTNARTDPWRIFWHKRKGQKYIMMWHGGVALKKIEKDAEDKLSYSYIKRAQADSRVCDLMISGCRAQTKLLEEKFWYDGEILKRGIPRNDIFFKPELHAEIRQKVFRQYSIEDGSRIVLYAPTFRENRSIEPYRIAWSEMMPYLRQFFGCEKVTVLLRMHPNLINRVDTSSLISCENVIDVTKYHDMQELLCMSDMLITDYSSSMFDFTMQQRPCVLYATDIEEYDRGYYYKFTELPYPVARNNEELKQILSSFDKAKYEAELQTFFSKVVGLCEDGHASEALAEWMQRHALK